MTPQESKMESKMRVAKMGHTQRVTKRDKKGRITSSWARVRIVVPDGLAPSLPPPYTGKKHLTKKTENDREAAAWTERFLAMIAHATERTTALKELAELDSLSLSDPDRIRRGPAVLAKLEKNFGMYEITGKPAWMAKTAEPITFDSMIERWAKYTNAPKKGRQDMTTKCGRCVAYLGHDNMAAVTFEDGRDWRDVMIKEAEQADGGDGLGDGPLSRKSISNHLKAVRALFGYAFDNYPDSFPANPMARVKFDPGEGEQREDFTAEERARILTMARVAEPHIYWLNWLSSSNAAR